MCACVFWGDEKRERFKKGSIIVTPSLLVIMPKKITGKTRTPQCDVANMTGCPHSEQPRVLLQATLHDDPILWKHQQTLPEKKIHTEPTSEREDVTRGERYRRWLSRQESCGVLADLFSGKEKC